MSEHDEVRDVGPIENVIDVAVVVPIWEPGDERHGTVVMQLETTAGKRLFLLDPGIRRALHTALTALNKPRPVQ
jgi:hypothetical protein